MATLAALALSTTPLVAQTPVVLKTTELGKGPTIVLLPGLGGTRNQWLPTARKLIGSFRVVMADLPGHGDSGMPDPFSYEAAAAALDQLLAKQNPESTIVVGQGVAGSIGLIEAKAHPERLKGLAVIDAQVAFKLPNGESLPDQQKRFFLDYIEENYGEVLRMMFTRMGRDSAQGVEIHAKAALVTPNNMKAYMRTSLDTDLTNTLKDLKTPLLYIGSSRQWPDTTSWSVIAKERGFSNAAGIRSRRIANSGALIMADQPDTLAAVIADFARSVIGKK